MAYPMSRAVPGAESVPLPTSPVVWAGYASRALRASLGSTLLWALAVTMLGFFSPLRMGRVVDDVARLVPAVLFVIFVVGAVSLGREIGRAFKYVLGYGRLKRTSEFHGHTVVPRRGLRLKRGATLLGVLLGMVAAGIMRAAVQDWVPFLETTLATWDRHFAVNTRGTFMMSQAVAKVMVKQGGGKIINLSSDSGLAPLPEGAIAYCATKSAIIAITRNIAKELGRHKVYCNAICPGAIMTPTTERFMQKSWEPNQNPEAWAQAAALRKVGYPEDIGRVALFLASYLSDHVTGEHILVTGGDLMSQ